MVVSLWSRDFFPPLYFDPRFRPLLLKYIHIHKYIYIYICIHTCFFLRRSFSMVWDGGGRNPSAGLHPTLSEGI